MIESAVCGRLALFQLGSEEGKGLSNRFADIYSTGSGRCRGSEPTKTPYEVIDSRDLSNDNLGEVVSKLFVVVPLGKKLRECPYRHKGVLDLMGHT
jgi:hypothetical protein